MNHGGGEEDHKPGPSTQYHDPHSDRETTGNMEINNHHHSHLSRKDIPTTSSLLYMHPMPHFTETDIVQDNIQSQLVNIDKYYRLQEDALYRKFEQQKRMLQTEQQLTMQEQIKFRSPFICSKEPNNSAPSQLQLLMLQKQQAMLEQQQAAAVQQQKLHQVQQQMHMEKAERHEEQLERIKNKPKGELSAIASDPVKAKLRECLIQKKTSLKNSPPNFRSWTGTQHSSLEQHSPPTSGLSPPLRPQLLGCYDDENPLRRTVSEPNLIMKRPKIASHHRHQNSLHPLYSPRMNRKEHLRKYHSNSNSLFTSEPNLKVRLALKQKMIERRSSPLLKRRDRHNLLKRNANPLTVNTGLPHSNPDSGPNTPPSGLASQGSSTETPPSADKDRTFPLLQMSKMVNQSMPNISMHREAHSSSTLDPSQMTEAEVRARMTAMFGLPLTGHMMPGPLPMYPMPVMEPGQASVDPSIIEAQMKALEIYQSTGKLPQLSPGMNMPGLSAAVESASTRGQYGGSVRSKLSRTHSAPLPLPGQLLLQHQMLMQQQELLKEGNSKQYLKQHRDMMKESDPRGYLKQRLQSSILQRSGTKNTMEDVDEETEARLAQEMREMKERQEEEEILVIDDPSYNTNQPEKRALTGKEAIQQKLLKARTHSAENSSLAVSTSEKLMRAQSFPTVRTSPPPPILEHTFTTGLAYDNLMLKHACVCGDNSIHPEHPGRLQSIYARLQETGLINKCERPRSRRATLDEIKSCHSEAYALLYGSSPQKLNESKVDPKMFAPLLSRFCKLPCGGVGVDTDTVWNENQTPTATRMAAGTVINMAFKIAQGELQNGFALVRPPGHHAESTLAMGFCYFNSIAIAAKQLLKVMDYKKVLILDWDVHHGNSTQQIFYADPRVLYISLHRHDNGNFFPGTGAPEECGIDRGTGYNVNLAFCGSLSPPMGDAEYMAAFRTIVMPIAREFQPEFVLVSAGFDGAEGHPAPLGGYNISPTCFGHMTKQVMTLANGKVLLCLEGGYDLQSICDSSEMCMRALLGEEIPDLKEEELLRVPCEPGLNSLEETLRCQAPYWSSLRRYAHTLRWSVAETRQRESDSRLPESERKATKSLPAPSGESSEDKEAVDTVDTQAEEDTVIVEDKENTSSLNGEVTAEEAEEESSSEPMEES